MTTSVARKWRVDVAPYVSGVSPLAATGWTQVKGIQDFDPKVNPTNADVSDYDSAGWSSAEKTALAAVWSLKARRPFDAGVYDAGQEIIRTAQLPMGDASKIFARYYDAVNGGPEARAGVFLVDWSQDKTGWSDPETIAVSLTSVGQVFDITNPALSTVAPSISAVTPAGKGTGQTVAIFGSGFKGASLQVLFAASLSGGVASGTAAADFSVISDQQVIATLPSGSAGSTAVAVKSAAGSSNLAAYTRAA